MSANNSHAAIATLDLIQCFGCYRTRLHALGHTSDLAELDEAIEQARLKLARLREPGDTANPGRFAELIDELRLPRRPGNWWSDNRHGS